MIKNLVTSMLFPIVTLIAFSAYAVEWLLGTILQMDTMNIWAIGPALDTLGKHLMSYLNWAYPDD